MDWMTLEAYAQEYPEIAWAIAAAVFFVMEVTIFTGIGFFFAAMAALTMSILVATGVFTEMSVLLHVGWFFVFITIWAIALWKPMKNWFYGKEHGYDNFKGTRATVMARGVNKDKTGQAKWSGASMPARVHPDSEVDTIEEGQEVYVIEHDGTTLLLDVKPAGTDKKETTDTIENEENKENT